MEEEEKEEVEKEVMNDKQEEKSKNCLKKERGKECN